MLNSKGKWGGLLDTKRSQTYDTFSKNSLPTIWTYVVLQLEIQLDNPKWLSSCNNKWIHCWATKCVLYGYLWSVECWHWSVSGQDNVLKMNNKKKSLGVVASTHGLERKMEMDNVHLEDNVLWLLEYNLDNCIKTQHLWVVDGCHKQILPLLAVSSCPFPDGFRFFNDSMVVCELSSYALSTGENMLVQCPHSQ